MSGASDWTERHRPMSEHQLEGNEIQRRQIREWLDGWIAGNPKKKGILLVGPPGVGPHGDFWYGIYLNNAAATDYWVTVDTDTE